MLFYDQIGAVLRDGGRVLVYDPEARFHYGWLTVRVTDLERIVVVVEGAQFAPELARASIYDAVAVVPESQFYRRTHEAPGLERP
jgi:hypothetical protein